MYLSVNFYLNNIYLYQKNSGSLICKNDFAYPITKNEEYSKITAIISNAKSNDLISIYDNDHINITINPLWSLKNKDSITTDNPIKKNILIPPLANINLVQKDPDLNTINCLCHDETHIINIPDITLNINDNTYVFDEWTGYNQVWCTMKENHFFYTYAYLYIFNNQSILLISQTQKGLENNHYFDLDIMSTYTHTNIIHDEYNRINCHDYHPVFSDLNILNFPLNQNLNRSSVSIETTQK
jgi:hypothetical protein